jgi:FkbM family methyltransferase
MGNPGLKCDDGWRKPTISRRLINFVRRCQRRGWSLVGGRRFTAFGHRLNVDAETLLPASRRYRLPRGSARDQVIRYTDHVQVCSISTFLEAFDGSPIVVEVGAYTGAYACIIGSLIAPKNGRMLAIEPDPQNCARLRNNIARNGLGRIVAIEELAISNIDGDASLTAVGSQSTIGGQTGSGLVVPAATLKTVLARHHISRIDLLIVDVEGAELPVLQGYPWETVPVDRIFCELHPYAWQSFGYEAADLDKFFADRGLLPIDMYFKPWPCLPKSTLGSSYIGPTLLVPISTKR